MVKDSIAGELAERNRAGSTRTNSEFAAVLLFIVLVRHVSSVHMMPVYH